MTRSVAVIGGGPAGLMAAEVVAEAGARVTVYELHRSPGRKLLLAGRSGLNLTHTEPIDQMLARYDPDPLPPVIETALRRFGPAELRRWVEGLGHSTFVGSSGRLFPQEGRAAPLLRSWLRRLDDLGVGFCTSHRWTGWEGDRLRFEVGTAFGGEVRESVVEADAVVMALGGASWPRVGGDGSWVEVLEADGAGVAPLRPANCGVVVPWSDVFRDRFEGGPIKNVVAHWDGRSVRGELVVTGAGLEGGPVYALSSAMGRAAEFPSSLVLDLAPDLDHESLVRRLASRRAKASQSTWLRGAGLAPVTVGLLREATANALPDDPGLLARLVKAASLPVEGLAPLDRAISTAGGVSFDSVDDGLMLRHRPGVHVAGEMLDWDAPTGGYLLQCCFSTGRMAGEAVRDRLGLGE